MDFFNQNIVLYLVAYLVSGIPFGYLLAKSFAGVDIKQAGSGNIGATNVLRVVKKKDPLLAKKLGAATLFLDTIKGMVVIFVAIALNVPESTLWTIAVFAVIGHCFSLFLGFEGGKGVATGFGVLLVMMPIPSLIAITVWLGASKGLKISSLSSLIGLVALLIASYLLYPEVPNIGSHAPIWIITIIIFYQHIPNIVRLIRREETKVV
ncbi:MAG: glycerol-3-phosphate 1-O-acyltransferase PlsY [Sulfurovum sp.]|nr:glycerol-3-phosphate 1-O-acyltransferase PlsY [Sulfurovum sp.]MCB4744454.1 glycerol-3-phosphate 1-O-acyltransferase PlsY [Sulfurovum sp.]MCB4745914.1 glycerol-3-phosphate 1-O-acyltransferase PlsY [Sulfurovum sp.]MCB4748981.1 glycerol-3-phosphate 1-O-acyltransferase PlsY [Sulfurovum sp.]MCB4749850.1 glycerol-3-phosphate 1-O-acyltransferase PlsY [Sulfurovum sp.]